ncbi:MAG: hypothetical protein KTR25_13120 [Myxococcales bacterium]|nr:hypothetical protein [Myxococcales bacterium]
MRAGLDQPADRSFLIVLLGTRHPRDFQFTSEITWVEPWFLLLRRAMPPLCDYLLIL